MVVELADTSAWTCSRRDDETRVVFDLMVENSEVATCDMVILELLYSARNIREFSARRKQLEELILCPISTDTWSRAIDVYQELGSVGGAHQRSVKHADLLVAAAAEQAGIAVLHYDEDFDRIAEITGQPTRWLKERGSL